MSIERQLQSRLDAVQSREAFVFLFGVAAFVSALVCSQWASDATEARDRAFGDAYRQCSADREISK